MDKKKLRWRTISFEMKQWQAIEIWLQVDMNTWRVQTQFFKTHLRVLKTQPKSLVKKMRFSIPKNKKKKKKTLRVTRTGTQMKTDACTFTHIHAWHHQHWPLTWSCGLSFLFDCISCFCSWEHKTYFLFFFLNSTIKFEYWKSRVKH